MHKFIYSVKDTFISNESSYIDKNFGLDEILNVHAKYYDVIKISYINTALYTGSLNVNQFEGTLTGNISGSGNINGIVII